MKKMLFLIVLFFSGTFSSYSQADLKLGLNGGFPVGDKSSFTDFHWGLDAAYLFQQAGIFQVGPLLGYSSFVGDGDQSGVQFIPLAASGRVDLSIVFLGVDLGYAIAATDGVNGGIYYRPKVGLGMRLFNLIASYSGINVDEGQYSSVNLGIELSL